MVRKPIEFIAVADRDIDEAFEWYRARSPDAAVRFLIALRDAVELISGQPENWPAYDNLTRSCPLRKFPYRVVYLNQPDRVRVVAVAHERRKPDYWKRRS